MKKLALLFLILSGAGCAQVNLASNVYNVTIVKVQVASEEADMSGSKLDDVARDMAPKAGDVNADLTGK